jgi:hypothetical protein
VRDGVAVRRSDRERFQDEEVKSSGDHLPAMEGRRTTLRHCSRR